MFVIKALTFHRQNRWETDVTLLGPMLGQMELISTEKTQLTMQLTAEQTRRILSIVSEALVDTAKSAASMVTSEVIDQIAGVAKLEAPSDD